MDVAKRRRSGHVGLGLAAWIVLAVGVAVAAQSDLRLVEAVKQRNTALARTLLQQRVDVNAPQPDGATALHWAVHWNDAEMASLLIRAHANVNAANDLGVTPLSLACTNASAALVEMLLQVEANPNARTRRGEPVLMTCARTGNPATVKALVAHGADVRGKEEARGQTALMWAAAENHAAVVEALVEAGADIQARTKASDVSGRYARLLSDYRGGGAGSLSYTALLFAVRQGAIDAARVLLDHGANVNDVAGDGTTALLTATYRGQWEMAHFLLSRGADPNLDGGAGYLPLHWAAGAWETILYGVEGARPPQYKRLAGLGPGKLELVKDLLARGANPNARMVKVAPRTGTVQNRTLKVDTEDATPFVLAAEAANAEIMRVLLAAGADPRLTAKDGSTALLLAAGGNRSIHDSFATEKDAMEAATVALEAGNAINASNEAGNTPLHAAVHWGREAMVQFLIDRGADINAQNKGGRTPLSVAEGVQAEGFHSWPHLQALFRKLSASNGGGRVVGPITEHGDAACPEFAFDLLPDVYGSPIVENELDIQFNHIVANANTEYVNGTCADLKIGTRVEIRGRRDIPEEGRAAPAHDRTLFATQIVIEKPESGGKTTP